MADDLSTTQCVSCSSSSEPLSDDKINELLEQLPGWKLVLVDGIKQVTKTYEFVDFKSALSFTNKVGELAENVNHHPSIITAWGSVQVSWWTHKIDGIHLNDLILAKRCDESF